MGKRGVTRPMEMLPNMEPDKKPEMLRMHHKQTQWVYWAVMLLGCWMILAPFTFGYDVGVVAPSGGRSVWLSLSVRIAAMMWSDIVSGALLVLFGWRSLTPGRAVSGWIICGIGIWLSAAPLIFWAPTAVCYMNDTMVGAWLIALSILIPGMPNMVLHMKMGAETPPGWSYNPSSWAQRWILIALGFVGWLVSRYLAAFQLGYITSVWDPFFGDSTRQVLNSSMSHGVPISDAGLGSLAYTFEFLMGFMGTQARWRTMPWMVTLFGILVIPLGLVHIFLVISQPIIVGHWCTFCLLAAAIMLPMIPLEFDEVLAMLQFVRRSVRRGESFWKTFWMGGADSPEQKGGEDERSPNPVKMAEGPIQILRASIWGFSVPYSLLFSAVLGLWLVFAPAVFDVSRPVANFTHAAGLLAVTFSVIAMGEVIRMFRWVNIVLALALIAVPIWASSPALFTAHHLLAGILLIVLSVPKGRIFEKYGTWQRMIR
ncbi:MAG: vitamin K epoxide reductase [Bdellovibrionales bacterium RIFOXYC1_FULL_54_43]|nr:MAG: vitamin K epoxide reductase [Bdellovibrionales bacterium RIFOXYC1_FULL_54_43]OFZ80499.1 MAG: vitamin K epoxide reductase [Bdellovibrionales bacterium RIFOXYD1_FULL_55_31]